MKIIKTKIKDVVIIEPTIFSDNRGYFFESHNEEKMKEAGYDYKFIQDNQSKSEYGTIRGLHLQKGEHSQAKLVRVLHGKVIDVAVDCRKDSETFGQHVAVELSEENNLQLLIPRGFAHGFSVLSDEAVFAYKCDNKYCKEAEAGFKFDDKNLNINWQVSPEDAILSDKDNILPTFGEFIKCI